ncbi:MAG: non-canonical purine NTP pyrophosphatase [Verrucomicrobia bacterium]|nr:non-canonical purine NTP pyrophosphatase [Verrucomicrobiota bacterium]
MTTIILATRNAHKAAEIRSILGDGFMYQTLKDLPSSPEIIEDADSFRGNAKKKAEELAIWITQINGAAPHALLDPETGTSEYSHLVLADDSGLEVDALNGAPGVHSARFAALDSGIGGNSTDADNNAKLLHLLDNVPPERRLARFRCVLALACFPSKNSGSSTVRTELFDGVCEGSIGLKASGAKGFGYDPLFIPTGFVQTFAELGEATKNSISHRSDALAKLSQFFAGKHTPSRANQSQA